MTYAQNESPNSSVVRAPEQCTGGHGFDSRRRLRFFLCPTLMAIEYSTFLLLSRTFTIWQNFLNIITEGI